MPTPVRIPELGAAGQTMRLSAWFVEAGDSVEAGDPLFEVLISGVTCDVAAEAGGRVTRIDKQLDDSISTGDVVAWIDVAQADDQTAG